MLLRCTAYLLCELLRELLSHEGGVQQGEAISVGRQNSQPLMH